MKKFLTFLALACLMVTGAWADAISTNQLFGFSTPTRGAWIMDGTTLKGTQTVSAEVNANQATQQFAIYEYGGKKYLWSQSAQHFLNNTGQAVAINAASPIDWTEQDGGTTYFFKFTDEANKNINIGGQGQITIDGWSTADPGNKMTLTAVDGFDLSQVEAVIATDLGAKDFTVHIKGAPADTKVTYNKEQQVGEGDIISAKPTEISAELITCTTLEGYSISNVTIIGFDIFVTFIESFEGKAIASIGEKTQSIQPNTWYVLTQVRNGETPAYDTGNGNQLKRAALTAEELMPIGTSVPSIDKYLVRFINISGEAYMIQFGTGQFWNGVNSSTTPGTYMVYATTRGGNIGGITMNVTNDLTSYGALIDNNGKNNTIATWNSGKITSGDNNVWYIYPVEFSDASQYTDVTYVVKNAYNEDVEIVVPSVEKGASAVIPTIDYYTGGNLTETNLVISNENKTFHITGGTWNFPVQDGKYYTMKADGASNYVSDGTNAWSNGSVEVADDNNIWQFEHVANTLNLYKIKNKKDGYATVASSANQTLITFAETATEWTSGTGASSYFRIVPNGAGFDIQHPGDALANAGRHVEGKFGFWNHANSANDQGSRNFVTEVASQALTVHFTGAPEGGETPVVTYAGKDYAEGETINGIGISADVLTITSYEGMVTNTIITDNAVNVTYMGLPVAGQYIRLKNHNYGTYMNANGTAINGVSEGTGLSTLWQVKSNESGALQLMNVANGAFVGDIAQSQNVTLSPNNTTTIEFETVNGYLVFKQTDGGQYQYGHIAGGNSLVGWEKSANATQWTYTVETEPAQTSYAITTTGLPAGATGGIAYGGQIYTTTMTAAAGLVASQLFAATVENCSAIISGSDTNLTVAYTYTRPFPYPGEVYTIQAKFTGTEPNIYLTADTEGLKFPTSEGSSPTSYWVARATDNTNYPWSFQSGYGDGKSLNVVNGVDATATKFAVQACTSVEGVYHLHYNDGNAGGERNVGTYSTSNAKTGFGAYGDGGCWAQAHAANGDWTADYVITPVEGVVAYNVVCETENGGIDASTITGYAGATLIPGGGVIIVAEGTAPESFTAAEVGGVKGEISVEGNVITVTYGTAEGYTLHISKHGLATIYCTENLKVPENVKVYVCTPAEGKLMTEELDSNVMQGYFGYIVEGEEGDYTFEYTEEEYDGSFWDELFTLHGVEVDTPTADVIAEEQVENIYVLSVVNEIPGFYKYAGDTLSAHKAYYAPWGAEINGFALDFGGQTVGVSTVISATNLKAGFDIQGRRINKMQKGINILNGKKIIK